MRILLLAEAAVAIAASAAGPSAMVDLRTASGAPAGHATFTVVAGGVRLAVDATGLAPGTHGIHLHTVGKCDAPDFSGAGGHWNPAMRRHGSLAAAGPHAGDLPNIVIAADGTGHEEAMLSGTSLIGGKAPLLDKDGTALVIHAEADDYRTDPSGNSGARIACGVVTAG